MSDWTRVKINFEMSHLLFPTVVAILLALLGAAILIRDRRAILSAGSYWSGIMAGMDKPRFMGTILLTIIYFSLMVPIGNLWPNTGYGFLFCSIPFVFLTGLLLMHDRSIRQMVPLAIVAIGGPAFVWWLFTYPLFLTLP